MLHGRLVWRVCNPAGPEGPLGHSFAWPWVRHPISVFEVVNIRVSVLRGSDSCLPSSECKGPVLRGSDSCLPSSECKGPVLGGCDSCLPSSECKGPVLRGSDSCV